MSNNVDKDQARHFVGPDLGTNCLQRLSADNSSRQRVKSIINALKHLPCVVMVSSLLYGYFLIPSLSNPFTLPNLSSGLYGGILGTE